MMLTFTLLLAVSGMLAPEGKSSLDDSLKKYESKYEEQYQQDLQERMDAAKTEKQDEQEAPKADPEDLDAPELKPDPEELDATPQETPPKPEEAEPAPKMADMMGALAGLTPGAMGADAPVDPNDEPSVDQALEKLKTSAKMMVVLHVLMKPISTKLHVAMAKMGDADKAKAQGILDHLGELDGLSEKAVELLKQVDTVKHGNPEERKEALDHLITGMKDIQEGVQTHLLAMRRPEAGAHRHMKGKLPALTEKLHAQIHKMEDKVKMELADPERKDDPLVKLDVEVMNTMKTAVKKAESLVVVAAVAMKQAKNEDQKTKIKHAVKAELQDVMTNLKKDMSHLKEKTVIVEAVRKLKQKGGLKGLLEHLAAKKAKEAKEEENPESESQDAPEATEPHGDDKATDDGAATATDPQGDDSAAAESSTTKDAKEKPEAKDADADPARPKEDGKFGKLLDQLDALKSSFKNKDSANLRKNAAEEED